MKKGRLYKNQIVRYIKSVLGICFCAALAVLCIMPMVITFSESFMSSTELRANYGMVFDGLSGNRYFIADKVNIKLVPDWVSFTQYREVLFMTPEYLLKYWNSIIYVVPIVLFQLIIALLAAYGFHRCRGKAAALVFFGYIVLMMMPFQVTLVPNYLVSKWLGILDTRFAIWFPGIFSPFSVYLLTRHMNRIPADLADAASVDGAGEWRTFLKIYVPLCREILTACALLVFFDYWNMVEQPLILLRNEELYPLSILLANVNSNRTDIAFALAVIYMFPGLLMFFYGEDELVMGISCQGGLKG